MKILIVEDENSIREVETAYLKQSGFSVTEATNGESAIEKFKQDKFDLVVLDINLPQKNGLEVCKEIRKTSQVPIIMVTARVEEIDEIIGLEAGADDYLKKPFSPSVLVARVRALTRRIGEGVIKVGELTIDPEKMIVQKNEEKILLTTTQFNILYTLAKNKGRVYTRDEILDRAYDSYLPPDVLDRTIDAHIKSIRKKIEDDTRKPTYVLTVVGKGYKFSDSV